jgi:hypothetical protein
LEPLLFLLYINDLPKIINNFAIPIIFVDDTSILLTHFNTNYFKNHIHITLEYLNRWFKSNRLYLNFNKTYYIHFTTKGKMSDIFTTRGNNNCINNTLCTKFLGIMIDDALTWKNHVHLLAKKLSKACYLVRNVKPYMSIIALKAIYYSFFSLINELWYNFLG